MSRTYGSVGGIIGPAEGVMADAVLDGSLVYLHH